MEGEVHHGQDAWATQEDAQTTVIVRVFGLVEEREREREIVHTEQHQATEIEPTTFC